MNTQLVNACQTIGDLDWSNRSLSKDPGYRVEVFRYTIHCPMTPLEKRDLVEE